MREGDVEIINIIMNQKTKFLLHLETTSESIGVEPIQVMNYITTHTCDQITSMGSRCIKELRAKNE